MSVGALLTAGSRAVSDATFSVMNTGGVPSEKLTNVWVGCFGREEHGSKTEDGGDEAEYFHESVMWVRNGSHTLCGFSSKGWFG